MELNFVPVYHAVVSQRGTKADIDRKTGLSFFVARKQAQAAGSLISTYRVVNTTLRAESEKTVAPIRIGVQESFSYQRSLVPRERDWNRLIKLQRAHNGCLGANRR